MHTKRATIHTLGCRLNQAESGLIADQLAAAGYVVTPWGEAADLGVIHTCTVTREADAKSRQMIRQFIRANPAARTVVIGCYAETGSDVVARIPGVDLVLGNRDKLDLARHLDALDAGGPRMVTSRPGREPFTVPWVAGAPPVTRRMNLKIQDGCDFMCSFCAIPFARGRSRSREFGDLVAEARCLAGRGAKEVVLSGINVGDYSFENRTLLDVVDALNGIGELARVRLASIELTTVPEGMLARMADPNHRLAPFLHVPLQSGADRILAAMRRNYTRADYLALVRRAAETVPDVGIGADILVGFPGETDADFDDSLALLRGSPVCFTHVFKYSERRNSAASRLPEKTDPAAASARGEALRSLGAAKLRAFQDRHLGRTVEVLFEGGRNNTWRGHMGNYLEVAVRSTEDMTNRLCRVVVDGIEGELITGTLTTM
jgi:threonylcarbamoyladenosine tRNA methylthiotransferase MtaB